MAKNTVGDFIRSVFSTLIDKDDGVFKALFSSPDETGTVEKIFNELEETRDEWCNTPDVYGQSGEMLEKSLSYFSILQRLFGEDDESLKERNSLLYYRNGDTIWGDKWNIIGIFKSYFRTDFIFIVNNTNLNEENLLEDGDFEARNVWALEDCVYDFDARFSERTGVLFNSPGTCSQSVSVDGNSTYFLHFFLNGTIDVEIKDNNGRYWNKNRGEFGEWQSAPASARVSADGWGAESVFFFTDEETSGVTVKFSGVAGNVTFLDYVRLFKKYAYSSFTLIACFSGQYSAETMGLAPGTKDPVRKRDYSGYGHFSDGKQDGDIDPGNLSFFESAAVNDDKEPLLASGEADLNDADRKTANDAYLDEGTPLAPWEKDEEGVDVDYSRMSYVEQSHLYGTGVVRPESVYRELLEIVRAGGITPYIEILTRESEA